MNKVMYKKIFKYLAIFLGIGFIVGGLTTAFVVSSQKNSSFNETFVLGDQKIKSVFAEPDQENKSQYFLNLDVKQSEMNYSFKIDNFDKLKNVSVAGSNEFFTAAIKDSIVTITVEAIDKDQQYPTLGEIKKEDPLFAYKGLPILQLKADNVQTAVLIYLIISVES